MDVGVQDFEDIAVYFSEEEWGYLGEEQRRLYKEVMLENYKALCSLGSFYLKPELISNLERGKEPCVRDRDLYNGEIPIAYFIVPPDILSKLPEVLHDDDEADCIYLEIDSDSEIEQEKESYTSEFVEIEDDSLSDCVYLGPEVLSLPEPRIKPSARDAALCEDENALDCVYVESEDETIVQQVKETGEADLEEDDDNEEDDDEDDDEEEDSSSDCVYVEAESIPATEWQKQKLVKCEDQCEEDQELEVDNEQIISHSDPSKSAHCQTWESKTLNGIAHDAVSPVNHTTNKNHDSTNNLLNVWYVKTVGNSANTHKEIVVPGTPSIDQGTKEDSADEGAEHDQITDLELLCPMCPKIFTNVSKFFEHQKDHEPKTPVCPECGARFSDNFALERHLLLHIEEKIQVCQECGQCFTTQSALETHMKTHKGDKQWSCPDCGKFLYSKSGLDRHQLIHVRDKPVPCPQCGKRFIKQSNFEMHLRLHAGEEFYPCTDCEKLFSSKAACERHIRAHTSERPHGCPQCGKRFLYNGCLIKHMRVHTGEKPYICPECGKCFAQSSSLNCHRRLHEDEKPYVCPECKKCFSKKFHFDTHLKIHAKDRLLDEIAKMKGENVSNLVSSAVNPSGEKLDIDEPVERPFKNVSLMNGQFGNVAQLGLSERHVGDVMINGGPLGVVPYKERPVSFNGRPVIDVLFNGRPFGDVPSKESLVTDVSLNNWPVEDLSFIEDPFIDISSSEQSVGENSFIHIPSGDVYYSEKGIMDILHSSDLDVSYGGNPLNSRAEEKQHVCPECGKSFPYNGCLVKHLRTHTGEKPYACNECGKCFAQTSTLNCHKRTHTGERPYVCPQCGKGFTSQSHVVRHQAIHNVNRSFLCNGCGKEFSQRSYLLKHQKRMTCSQTF